MLMLMLMLKLQLNFQLKTLLLLLLLLNAKYEQQRTLAHMRSVKKKKGSKKYIGKQYSKAYISYDIIYALYLSASHIHTLLLSLSAASASASWCFVLMSTLSKHYQVLAQTAAKA